MTMNGSDSEADQVRNQFHQAGHDSVQVWKFPEQGNGGSEKMDNLIILKEN